MAKKNHRILVVDDEQDLCEILKFNLETEGYEVETAGSAEEALTLDLTSFDLLLLDVMMGEMSGFALARKLKSEESTKDIPIIFLTARDTENDTVTGFNLGADDYISKPFHTRSAGQGEGRAAPHCRQPRPVAAFGIEVPGAGTQPRQQDGEHRRRASAVHQDRV